MFLSSRRACAAKRDVVAAGEYDAGGQVTRAGIQIDDAVAARGDGCVDLRGGCAGVQRRTRLLTVRRSPLWERAAAFAR